MKRSSGKVIKVETQKTNGVHKVEKENPFVHFIYHTVFPSFLISTTPIFIICLWYTHAHLGGSFAALLKLFLEDGPIKTIMSIWPTPSLLTWKILAVFVSFEAFLLLYLPGKPHRGPKTATGHIPVYRGNGFQAFFITMSLVLALHYSELFPLSIIYDLLGEILSANCVASLVFCLLLYIKGALAPSSTDHHISGNFIFDYFWGVELYPRVGALDLKMLVNCRVAMMGWPILVLCCVFKQQQLYGFVSESLLISAAVQLVYIAKFFHWETGYLDSIDIIHDRFGFYICWGCLSWLPSLYPNCSYYLVHHPIRLSPIVTAALLIAGLGAVYINYAIDEQRQRFRKTKGKTIIWGKPAESIRAQFTTTDGQVHESLLLVSGWWGVSRHFNYAAEITAALLWVPPVQFEHFLPYSYVTFLIILLVHRAFRDDARCSKKYGKYFEEYKKRVPDRILPFLF